MHPILQRSSRFEDLLELGDHDAPYVFEGIFKRDGFRARSLSKKKYKLLKRIDLRLRSMLEEGERVRFLSFGSDLSFWESYFLGFAGYLMNRRAIVLTDRRMLLLQIDWRERPRELLGQIRYPTIASIKRTILGNTLLRLNDGEKRVFQGVPKADRIVLQELSTRMSGLVSAEDAGAEDLCPHCYGVVVDRPARCGVCGGGFKSARTAALRSLVFPGLGDFYLGHWKLAIWETLIVSIVWLSVLFPGPEIEMTAGALAVIGAFVFLFMHVPDALVTRYIARKGLYPAGGAVGARVAARRRAEARLAARTAPVTAA